MPDRQCTAQMQITALACHLLDHAGVLHYDAERRIYWADEAEIAVQLPGKVRQPAEELVKGIRWDHDSWG